MSTICTFINSFKKRAGFAALVALIAAAPAWARVDITATQFGEPCDGRIKISFDASSETNLIRAFSFDIQLDNDANILEVIGLSADYYIYPGTIQIDAFGNVIDYGTALAEYSDLPSGTLPGLDSNGVTIELASLYAPVGPGSPNAPAKTGDLVSINVSGSTCITITANVARTDSSGVVMEDPNEIVQVNFPPPLCVGYHPCIGCYCRQADYDEWLLVGMPACWCYQRQCHGDADGLKEGSAKAGYWYVGLNDLNILVSAWKVLEPAVAPTPSGPGITSVANGACADFDHLKEGSSKAGYWRVGLGDLNLLVANWKILEPAVAPTPGGPGVPGNCAPGNESP
ncbi:MAG: hypothetical protein OEW48_16990 [Phycisphaerae bacterium]|nr:hypothetical protein [Phycisphaerae bacterium]